MGLNGSMSIHSWPLPSPRVSLVCHTGGLRFQGERVDSGHTLAVWRAADLTLLVTSLLSGADIEEHVKLLRAHAAQGAQTRLLT